MTTPYGSDPQQPPGGNPPAPDAGEPSPTGEGLPGGQPPYGQPPADQPTGQPPYGQPPYGQSPYGQPPAGQPPYGQPPYDPPPYSQQPYGGYGPPPPNRRRTGLIVAAIMLAVLLIGGLAAALVLNRNGDKASGDNTRTPSTGQQASPKPSAGATPSPSTPPAVARPYCAKLKTIDRDPRLLSITTTNPADVVYAIHKFRELGAAAPPVIHADWARVNLAIEKGLHGQTAPVTQSQLQQSFNHIKSEAETDCNYTLRGGPFG
jgi:hypothetical protein